MSWLSTSPAIPTGVEGVPPPELLTDGSGSIDRAVPQADDDRGDDRSLPYASIAVGEVHDVATVVDVRKD
jgi:hypothetical protein